MNAKSILFSFFCRYPSLFSRVQLSKSNPDVSQLAFLSLVGRGQTVFDVGANFGGYTRLFSKLVGQRAGGVYAFEPVAASMKRLQQAVQGLNNVVLVRKGLGLALRKPRYLFLMVTSDSHLSPNITWDPGLATPVVLKKRLR